MVFSTFPHFFYLVELDAVIVFDDDDDNDDDVYSYL